MNFNIYEIYTKDTNHLVKNTNSCTVALTNMTSLPLFTQDIKQVPGVLVSCNSSLNTSDPRAQLGNASGLHRSGVGSILGEKSPYNEGEAIVIAVVLFCVIVVTIVGNILVCVAVCLVRKLRRPCNYLLVSLAVSDLCVAILVMPLALLYEILGTWPFGNVLCDVWVSFDVLSCTASILNLCMISVDRYCAITKPLEYGVKRTPRRMIACVSLVWLGAACISLPPLLILGNEHGDDTECTVCLNFWYQIYATLGSFYIPLCIMIVVYYKIFRAARKIVLEERKAQSHLKANKPSSGDGANHKLLNHHKLAVTEISRNGTTTTTTTTPTIGGVGRWSFNKGTHNDSSWSLGERGSSVGSDHCVTNVRKKSSATKSRLKFALAKERKASTTLGIIMSAFTICWFPFFVLALVRPFLSDPLSIPHSLSSLFLWLGYANSLLNPIIYATLNKDFRKPFQEILCMRCSSLNVMMREEFYYSQYGDPDITIAYQTTRYRSQYEEDSPALQTDSVAEQHCPLAPEKNIVKDNESFL